MKILRKTLLTLIFFIVLVNNNYGQIISKISTDDINRFRSKKNQLKFIVNKQVNKFINIISSNGKIENKCFVVNIIAWDEINTNCVFSISYIMNRSEIKSVNAFGFFETAKQIVIVKTKNAEIKRKFKIKKTTQRIVKKIKSHLSDNESNPLNYYLYEPDYMIVEINKENGIYQYYITKMIETKYEIKD